ncbi:hypothetical protein QFC21_002985 [Naganishia friedmannii]|uniref:Uncharacterized protein n=1 Tax=Naganishia friedmannii TaxID=89922 RepID=A0ACC2VUB3_9TREE|nr:hypothetical protein QFC21_002985 [Naganishia friedmannii]
MAAIHDSRTLSDRDITEAAAYKRLYPVEYLRRFVVENVRPDGRNKDQARDVKINVANGSALVRLGDTTVVCGIKAEIAEPDWKTPNHGWIVPNLDLPALSSPHFKPGPPAEEAQVFSQQLNDLLVSSNVLPLSALCIEPKRAAWVLYVDLVCINYDGNAFDASVLAVMAALRDTCTFGIFKGEHLLPDPTAFETPLLDTTITIALDSTDFTTATTTTKQLEEPRIRLVRQNGLGGLGGKQSGTSPTTGIALLGDCIVLAKERVKTISEVLYGM